MKVFILTEGGKDIGFGHLARCGAIYEAFKERGITPAFVVNADNTVVPLLKNKKNRIFNWLKRQEESLSLIKGADIVIVDSYLAGRGFYRKVSETAKAPLYIDDYKRVDYPRGIVLNGNSHAEGLGYPKKRDVAYLLGTSYTPLRKEFWSAPEKKISNKVKSIMITFGGDDSRNMTPKVLKLLIDEYPGLIKNVVVGKGFKNIKSIEKMKNGKARIIYYPDAGKMKTLMLKSDIAISAGGQTLYEFARIGVPTIAVSVANNQYDNIKGLQKTAFVLYAGCWDHKNLMTNLSKGIKELMPYKIRIRKSMAGRKHVDGAGARRIADRLINAVSVSEKSRDVGKGKMIKLRRAREKDCRDLWIWRNHPDTRRWSYDPAETGYSDHKNWFKKATGDKNVRIYIAEDAGRRKVGQARFKIGKNGLACISINLNPYFFGKGFGNKVIKKATEYIMMKEPEIKTVTAEIFEANIISKKAFQKAEYVFSHDAFKNGKKIAIFKFERR